MIYIILNSVGIILGAFIGRLVGHKLSEQQINSVLIGANLSILVIGIQGAIETKNFLLMIISLCIGGALGTALDIDGNFHKFGNTVQSKIKIGDSRYTKGVIQVIMMHIIGSMAILGPVDVALKGEGTILIIKTILDFTSTLIFSTTFGFGVALSGLITFLYQGAIYFLASFIAPILTTEVVNEISAIGSVLIIALSLSLLNLKEIKVSNFLPAILGPIVYYFLQILF